MKACGPRMMGLTICELEAIASGEVEAEECEVETAALILASLDEQDARAEKRFEEM